ncbi:hypothetical protein [Lactiplantibacillus fabifermentans]|uniref:Uncharacterized protein n=2 Tax=Lactiplantibacillus fabifermentans TaxID=483011 RepID=A0A0R2NTP6_9LACO|nr:hypothetical protein [Lactiplantibacillus fabifermentans]ETY73030.1 hypothetical protein LFAB_14640 [Lactiplantibacillus fabifermentans T30PCM01]KRO29060.1 hypothetical protein DY78_GL001468 [Lactiplantibacillus fabifermentans DSM 21115]
MNPAELIKKYLTKYHITLQHPEHGLVMLTSPVWPEHPELQQAILQAVQGLNGVQQVTVNSPEQLVMRYDSEQLRKLNPLALLSLERKLSRQYHQAGY